MVFIGVFSGVAVANKLTLDIFLKVEAGVALGFLELVMRALRFDIKPPFEAGVTGKLKDTLALF